jgi:hypothetical protein
VTCITCDNNERIGALPPREMLVAGSWRVAHVIPRMDWFGENERGPGVFSLLGASAETEVPEAERDALALRLRDALRIAG